MGYRKGETRSTAKKVGGLPSHKKHAPSKASEPSHRPSKLPPSAISTSNYTARAASPQHEDASLSENEEAPMDGSTKPVRRKKGKKFASENVRSLCVGCATRPPCSKHRELMRPAHKRQSNDILSLALSIADQQDASRKQKVEKTVRVSLYCGDFWSEADYRLAKEAPGAVQERAC